MRISNSACPIAYGYFVYKISLYFLKWEMFLSFVFYFMQMCVCITIF